MPDDQVADERSLLLARRRETRDQRRGAGSLDPLPPRLGEVAVIRRAPEQGDHGASQALGQPRRERDGSRDLHEGEAEWKGEAGLLAGSDDEGVAG